jgi:adenylate cyclase
MEKRVFVAREQELSRLDGFLEQALTYQGLACFVTGEAGSGKTALVTEFVSQAQEKVPNLVVAVGQSNAQTGIADAHLPFREILGQLTGDVEVKLAQGVITSKHANQLHKVAALSCQTLAEVGPDLVGIFVPGAKLVARAGAFVAKKAGWLDKLEKLAGKPPESSGQAGSVLEQSHIFEQYANFLRKLSEKHPLMLVLDDLQWADVASVELFFYLARRIAGQRILLIGTYRPEEVSIGRAGERHPLEKVLAEIKRYFGNVWIDLDQAMEDERRSFVKAYLDSEPNQLKADFYEKLYQHTTGHPLFTIELLRNLQEQGDLIRDEQGRWVETPTLNWELLPQRVEGVIEERIGRLEKSLRQILTVASVEGEDFTAEVVASVLAVEPRELVKTLSSVLARQHHLVMVRCVRQLEPSGQRLSLYRFQHNLIQKYIYNELDEAERAYLHEDVGIALEKLFTGQLDEIVVQLARHFDEAKLTEKACHYLYQSGKQAADRFANEEAVAYFSRALELTPEGKTDEQYSLLRGREQIYSLMGRRELQGKDLAIMQDIANRLGDNQKKMDTALCMAKYALATSDYNAASEAARQAVALARGTSDIDGQAEGCFLWGISARYKGALDQARHLLEQAHALSHRAGLRLVEASSLRNLGILNVNLCNYDEAKKYYEQSLDVSREAGDRRGESKTLNNLGALLGEQGDVVREKAYYEQARVIAREIGDRRNEGILLGNLGEVSAKQGDLQSARRYFEQCQVTSQEVGDRDMVSWVLVSLGDLEILTGDLAQAKSSLEQALLLAREIGSHMEELSALNGLTNALTLQGDYSAACELGEQALRLADERGDHWNEAMALSLLGTIHDCLGNYSSARGKYEASLQIASDMNIRLQEGDTLACLGLLYHHLGEDQTACNYNQRAVEIAQELDAKALTAQALSHLGHALVGLGHLTEAGDAYRTSITLRKELGQLHLVLEPLAGIGRISLIKNQASEAQSFIEEILNYLKNHTLAGIVDPMGIYLTCYQTLLANQDPRAGELLNTAYTLLQQQAAGINDREMRSSYLENVPTHHKIVQAFMNRGLSHKPGFEEVPAP